MSNTPISKCYSLRLNHCLNISINKFSQSSMIRFMYSNVTWILTAIYTQAEKFLQCHWVTKRKEKKGDSSYIIESEKTKRKNLVVAISWKIKAKRGWWVKVWQFECDVFFSSLSILIAIQHYFLCYGQFLQKIRSTSISLQTPELVNQCPFVLLFDTFVCIECCEARNHWSWGCFSTLRTGLSGRP